MDRPSGTRLPGREIDDGRGRVFPCERCGADLHFHIGQQQLHCPFCGATRQIELNEDAEVREQDFHAALERIRRQREERLDEDEQRHHEVRCDSCGADVVFEGTLTSTQCPYCGSPIQRDKVHTCDFGIPVDAILPFQVERAPARQRFSDWVKSRWFAPNDFKKTGFRERFNGVYLPFWTYDSLTFTQYRGQRGVNYTVTVGTGKNRRTETRIRWTPVSGRFQRFFDDVLINATRNLPVKYVDRLAPWPLANCVPFSQKYLAGYFARTYDIELEEGFSLARQQIEEELGRDVRRRIGGDHQRIHRMDCRYDAITFKHLLLPVWMLAYRYKDKSYRVFVNAVTGDVQGERPYSWVKILLAVLGVITLLAVLALLANR
jgi:predicted RNA-binding Zn-ribbon protein involved in translation (DUF1610 family)